MATIQEDEPLDGPDQLVAELIDFGAEQALGLSREEICNLLRLAFRASLSPDEGRYPRFAFFVPARGAREPLPIADFSAPRRLDERELKRLAPSIPERPYALLIKKVEGTICATGIVRHEIVGVVPDAQTRTRAVFTAGSCFPGLLVSIDGPAELGAILAPLPDSQREAFDKRLHRGRIETAHDIRSVPVVSAMLDAAPADTPWETDDGPYRTTLGMILFGAIARASGYRHGGAIVVLPKGITDEQIEQHLQRDIRVDGPSLTLLASVIGTRDAHELPTAQFDLIDATVTLSRFTAIDGCVVMDHQLKVIAIGAGIRRTGNEDSLSCVRVPTAATDEEAEGTALDEFCLSHYGNRHRSAARLCKDLPGTIAFVISQDGAVRVFRAMKDGRVAVRGPVSALPGRTGTL